MDDDHQGTIGRDDADAWTAFVDREGGRFRMVFNSTGDLSDYWWSDSLLKMFATMSPLPLASLFTEQDRDRLQAFLASPKVGEFLHFTGLANCSSGRYLQVSLQLSSKHQVRTMFGAVRDLKVASHFLPKHDESEVFLETVLDYLPHMIFVKDAEELRFVRFNKAGERLLGKKNSDFIGKNDYDFFPKEQADAFTKKDREVLRQSVPVNIPEEPIETPFGLRYLHTQKITISDVNGRPKYLLGISIDITDAKRNREMIEEQREKLVQASRLGALGEMAGGIAHEINNPLAIISAATQYLQIMTHKGNLSADILQKNLTIISKTVERMANIVTGLRDFSRDGTKDPFVPTPLCDVLKATLPFCNERFRTHGVELEVFFPPSEWRVSCQSVRISQVLLNLLNNAFDSVLESGRENMRVIVSIAQVGKRFCLYVKDNGVGIDAQVANSIMLPFFTTKPVGKGTGLGLSISAGIVKDHGGDLTFRSLEVGAEFCVALPAAEER